MTELLAFFSEHWFLAWCALWLLWAPLGLAHQVLNLSSRLIRMIMVALRGWPPAHLDADGDWRPRPKAEPAGGE